MKLNLLLEKLAQDFQDNQNYLIAKDFLRVLKSPQGLEFLEAVYNRGYADYSNTLIGDWQSIKSEIEGEG